MSTHDFVQLPDTYHTLRQVGARLDGVNGSASERELRQRLMEVRYERPSELHSAIRDVDAVNMSGCA